MIYDTMVLNSSSVTYLLCCISCLLRLSAVEGGSEAEIIKALEETQKEVAWKDIPLSGPTIDAAFTKNVTAQLGNTAVLNCRIKYLGGKTLSWMRSRDLHLLTVGRFTYTSDGRFQALHQSGSDDWLLKIHYVQHRDAGAYECQVSTTPPISTNVWLSVFAEPETRVLGGPALYINAGSTINLTCVVNHSPDPPPYIFWYHEAEILSYDSPRGGITVVTEHGTTSSSRLLIQNASVKDAGRYACNPANAEPHHITVHIIPNEHPAAIHHKNGTSTGVNMHKRTYDRVAGLFLMFLLVVLSYIPFPSLSVYRCPAVPAKTNSITSYLHKHEATLAAASSFSSPSSSTFSSSTSSSFSSFYSSLSSLSSVSFSPCSPSTSSQRSPMSPGQHVSKDSLLGCLRNAGDSTESCR